MSTRSLLAQLEPPGGAAWRSSGCKNLRPGGLGATWNSGTRLLPGSRLSGRLWRGFCRDAAHGGEWGLLPCPLAATAPPAPGCSAYASSQLLCFRWSGEGGEAGQSLTKTHPQHLKQPNYFCSSQAWERKSAVSRSPVRGFTRLASREAFTLLRETRRCSPPRRGTSSSHLVADSSLLLLSSNNLDLKSASR